VPFQPAQTYHLLHKQKNHCC